MKQVFIVLLVLIMGLSNVTSAEGMDVSSLTDDELLELKSIVDAEVVVRGLTGDTDVVAWYDYGLGQYIPDPVSVFGHEVETEQVLKRNSDTMFMDTVKGITLEEFNMYAEATKAMGFKNIIETSGNWWEATRDDGIKARLVYLSDDLHIDVDPAE